MKSGPEGFVAVSVGFVASFFWRLLRTLGGKNIGKCRLRAHQHPLCRHCRTSVEPDPMQNIQGITRAETSVRTRAGEFAEGGPLSAANLRVRFHSLLSLRFRCRNVISIACRPPLRRAAAMFRVRFHSLLLLRFRCRNVISVVCRPPLHRAAAMFRVRFYSSLWQR